MGELFRHLACQGDQGFRFFSLSYLPLPWRVGSHRPARRGRRNDPLNARAAGLGRVEEEHLAAACARLHRRAPLVRRAQRHRATGDLIHARQRPRRVVVGLAVAHVGLQARARVRLCFPSSCARARASCAQQPPRSELLGRLRRRTRPPWRRMMPPWWPVGWCVARGRGAAAQQLAGGGGKRERARRERGAGEQRRGARASGRRHGEHSPAPQERAGCGIQGGGRARALAREYICCELRAGGNEKSPHLTRNAWACLKTLTQGARRRSERTVLSERGLCLQRRDEEVFELAD